MSVLSIFSVPELVGRSISGDIAATLLDALVGWEADLVKSLVGDVIGATTALTPEQGNHWFAGVAQDMAYIEPFAVAPLLFVATIGAVLRQDMRRLARAWGVGLPLALLGGFAVANLAFVGTNVTDALSSFVQAKVAPDLGADFAGAVTLGGAAGPVGALFGVVVLVGGVAIWLELVLRSVAVELAVFFMPLAFAGLVWPSTAHYAKRLLHVLVALLLTKPVVVTALCLGDNAILSVRGGPSALVTGTAILLLAAFAPMALFKLVPVFEVSAIAHLQGLSRQPLHSAGRAVQQVLGMAGSVASAAAAAGAGASPDGASQLLGHFEPSVAQGGAFDLGPASFPRDGPDEAHDGESASLAAAIPARSVAAPGGT
ncbi:MAG TPA: hypothetical protein VME20_02960 [Acidimicrobiales bacterium]|nr:hypothetical protein [Acidimicrobiales bacterium]